MADRDVPDPNEPRTLEIEVPPTAAGRIARWLERARILQARIEASRARHAYVDVGFDVVERDSSIGGALLAGALAYRLFVWLLPTSLLFVSGLGLYAGAAHKSTTEVAKESGLHGLIASQVASTAAGGARWIVFLVMIPAVLYATATLYRAVAKVHAIAWLGSGRGIRTSANGVALLAAALLAQLVAAGIVGWIRRGDQIGGAAALLVFLVLGGGTWLALSTQLPHRDVPWTALLPGAITVGVGLLFINVFNIYVTTRLVEGRADTYGALGVAAALLFSLVLVGRLVVVSAELNVSLADRRASHG
jgi:membrane protein